MMRIFMAGGSGRIGAADPRRSRHAPRRYDRDDGGIPICRIFCAGFVQAGGVGSERLAGDAVRTICPNDCLRGDATTPQAYIEVLTTGVGAVAGFLRKVRLDQQPASGEELPHDIVRALDASADDLEHGRIVDLDETLREMEAELEAHLTRRGGQSR